MASKLYVISDARYVTLAFGPFFEREDAVRLLNRLIAGKTMGTKGIADTLPEQRRLPNGKRDPLHSVLVLQP